MLGVGGALIENYFWEKDSPRFQMKNQMNLMISCLLIILLFCLCCWYCYHTLSRGSIFWDRGWLRAKGKGPCRCKSWGLFVFSVRRALNFALNQCWRHFLGIIVHSCQSLTYSPSHPCEDDLTSVPLAKDDGYWMLVNHLNQSWSSRYSLHLLSGRRDR